MGWICLIKVAFQHFSVQKSRARVMNRQPSSYSFWEKLGKFNIRSKMRNAAQSNATWLPLFLDGVLFSTNWASELRVCSYKTFSVNEVKFFSFRAFNGSQRCSGIIWKTRQTFIMQGQTFWSMHVDLLIDFFATWTRIMEKHVGLKEFRGAPCPWRQCN